MEEYQNKKSNFLKILTKEYLEKNPKENPIDIYDRMKMDRNTFYSYLREGKNSSPECWSRWIKGLKMSEAEFYKRARAHFK